MIERRHSFGLEQHCIHQKRAKRTKITEQFIPSRVVFFLFFLKMVNLPRAWLPNLITYVQNEAPVLSCVHLTGCFLCRNQQNSYRMQSSQRVNKEAAWLKHIDKCDVWRTFYSLCLVSVSETNIQNSKKAKLFITGLFCMRLAEILIYSSIMLTFAHNTVCYQPQFT